MNSIKSVTKQLNRIEEDQDRLLERKKSLCKTLQKKIIEKYEEDFLSWEEIGKAEKGSILQNPHESRTWMEASVRLIYSRDFIVKQLGKDPTDFDDDYFQDESEEWDDELWEKEFNAVREIENNFLPKLMEKKEEIRKEAGDKSWIDIIPVDPWQRLI